MKCIRDNCSDPRWMAASICERHWWQWYQYLAVERFVDRNLPAPFPIRWFFL